MSIMSVIYLPFIVLLALAIIFRKRKVIRRMCLTLISGGALFIAFIILYLITAYGGGTLAAWSVFADCAGVYLICLIFIWKPFSAKVRRVTALCIIGALAGMFAVVIYQNNIYEVPANESLSLYQYLPFIPDTLAKSLDTPSDLLLYEDLPRLDGATALYPLYSAFVRAVYPEDLDNYISYQYELYERDHDPQTVFLYCSRTSEAFDNLIAGNVDIVFLMGISDKQQRQADDAGLTLRITPIGSEAFVFFVNKRNKIQGLTTQNIKDIYAGKIKNWKDTGGANAEIRAYQRPENSGSQTQLERIMEGDGSIIQEAPTKDVYDLMSGMYKAVASYKNYKNSLGYSFRYYINDMMKDEKVRLLAIDGVEPTIDNIANDSYPFSDTFCAITIQDRESDNVKRLIEWILSPQGQSLVEKTGYVPLYN